MLPYTSNLHLAAVQSNVEEKFGMKNTIEITFMIL